MWRSLLTLALVMGAATFSVAGGGTQPPLLVSVALQQDLSRDADSLLKQAYDLKAQGKREEARVLFEKAMRDYPDTAAGAEARWMSR